MFTIVQSHAQLSAVEDSLRQYAYPFYTVSTPDKHGIGTGFLIKKDDITFLVTARHNFFQDNTNKKWIIKGVQVFLEPTNPVGKAYAFSLSNAGYFENCSDIECTDIIAFPLKGIDPSIKLKYVDFDINLDLKTISKSSIFIVGYPNDKLTVVSTSLMNWNGENSNFYTIHSSDKGGSGGPVFAYSENKKIYLIGLYVKGFRNGFGILTYGEVLKGQLVDSFLKKIHMSSIKFF